MEKGITYKLNNFRKNNIIKTGNFDSNINIYKQASDFLFLGDAYKEIDRDTLYENYCSLIQGEKEFLNNNDYIEYILSKKGEKEFKSMIGIILFIDKSYSASDLKDPASVWMEINKTHITEIDRGIRIENEKGKKDFMLLKMLILVLSINRLKKLVSSNSVLYKDSKDFFFNFKKVKNDISTLILQNYKIEEISFDLKKNNDDMGNTFGEQVNVQLSLNLGFHFLINHISLKNILRYLEKNSPENIELYKNILKEKNKYSLL